MLDPRWKPTALVVLPVALLSLGTAGQADAASKARAAGADASVASPSAPVLTAAAERAGQAAAGQDGDATAAEALAAYWTPERMRAAKPADAAIALRDAVTRQRDRVGQETARARGRRGVDRPAPTGPIGTIAPGSPRETSPALTARASAHQPGYPASAFPARTAGKVFFTKASGGNYVCSGTIINSEGKNSVWTAGHCVHGGRGGTWHSNWVFVPAYRDGAAPYGHWSSRQLWTKSDWSGNSEFASDIGVSIMSARAGWRIADYLGGQGITWNRSKRTAVTAFGYPAAAPFDGESLWACNGTSFPEWEFAFLSAQTLGLTCDMTGGSSGGGWLASFNGTTGYLNGNNSYKYDNDPNTMYSPHYDDTASSLYASTRGL